jgi:sugar/nucleoside kinase (ribokinase family)
MAVSAALLAERVGPNSWVVVRVGEEGCWIAARGLPPQHISGRPAQALDTTGAGDTHTAALVARLARGDAMPVAARIANVAASLSVERRGPATGPTAAELAGALAML